MSATVVPLAGRGLSLATLRQDADRVDLAVRGNLDDETAPLVALAAGGHVRMGRRYVRLDLGEVTGMNAAGLACIAALHQQLLGCRGTLVLTNVQTELYRRLNEAGRGLFLLAPTAADRARAARPA